MQWGGGERGTLPLSEPLPTTTTGHYTICCKESQSCAPEDGPEDCPKHVELFLEINKLLLLHLVGFYITLPTLMMHGQTQIKSTVTRVAISWIEAVNITRITFEILYFLVTFQFLRVEHPEDGVNDHKTCRNDTRLYFCESHAHWSVL
jgi:hypothetical protein